jgi:hypothetical protein
VREPVRRLEMRQNKEIERFSDSTQPENAPGIGALRISARPAPAATMNPLGTRPNTLIVGAISALNAAD